MNNVYDCAHELARVVKNSEEYRRYQEMKNKVSENEELSNMLNDFQQKQFQLQAQQAMGSEPETDMVEQIQNLYEIVIKDPLAAQYLQAEFAFTRIISDIYGILGDVMKVE